MKKEDQELCDRALEIHTYIWNEMNDGNRDPDQAAGTLTLAVLLTSTQHQSSGATEELEPRYKKLKKGT